MLECMICKDKKVLFTTDSFLRVIGISLNPEDFSCRWAIYWVVSSILNHIGFKGIYESKEFKKYVVHVQWMILMHFVIKGLPGKDGGYESISEDRLYVIYNIFTAETNDADHPYVLWQDFQKFLVRQKPN